MATKKAIFNDSHGNKHTINFGADAINVSVSAETAAKLGLTSAADLEAVLAKIAAHSHSAADVGAIPTSDKGKAGGVATLGSDGKVPTSQLPEMDYDAAGSAAAVQGKLDAHTGDTVKHVTAADRTAWNAKSGKAVAFTVTLSTVGWSENTQAVSDARFLTDGYAYSVTPDSGSFSAYGEAMIYADNVTTAGQMRFHCSEVPTTDLTVNILRMEVSA